MARNKLLICLAIFLFWTAGCGGRAEKATPPEITQDLKAFENILSHYYLQPGDRLDITFYQNPELNESVIVRPDGRISLQLIDEIQVAGLTPPRVKELLTERYAENITGVLSCFDRVVITGTLPTFCYANGMALFLSYHHIRIFDYPRFAEPLRDELRDNAERIARESGIEIEFIRKKNFRKEDRIRDILKNRGAHPGLVHIFSAMEPCQTYKPWHDKVTHKTFLKASDGKCLHYYFYFIDEELGLTYVRVPTWCPFRLQIYFNGHSRLAVTLTRHNIAFNLMDNAFAAIGDFSQAQTLSDSFEVESLHKKLDSFAQTYCPIIKQFDLQYHWSIMQAEYATDIIFKRQADLRAIYDHLTRTAIHTVKPQNIATFLGRKLQENNQDEIGNNFNTRIEGTRIKHSMGPASIKMYDKFSLILRIETTVNNVSFFKHYRKVEHRDGTESRKLAPMKKGIDSSV